MTRSKIVLFLSAILMCFVVLPQSTYAIPQSDDTEAQDIVAVDTITNDTLEVDTIPTLPWPQSLQAHIDTIIAKSSFLKTSQLGLMVYDLTADSVLYDHNAQQTLRPASTMKLLTAITALDKLGGAYLYKTRLCYTGSITDSTRVLSGDVYCIGGMDPKIGHDDIRAMAHSIKEAGIDTIRGNLYADRSMKDAALLGEGWCWDDKNPDLSPLVYGRKDEMVEKLRSALDEAGVILDDTTALNGYAFPITKTCPANATQLCKRTHTIDQVLMKMMKDSNNLYAESMLYQIGLSQGKPSTAKKGQVVEEALMRKIKMSDRPHRFADGSGLSLYNYVSAEIEVAFLRYAYENANIYTHLRPSLPIAGIDGTLEKRMRGTSAAGNIHAKTGTLSGVSSLAGYGKASNGHDICFAIINQGVMKAAPAKTFQDKICIAITK